MSESDARDVDAWRDANHIPLDDLTDAMAVYSNDGQLDDVTGGDAGAEEAFGHDAQPRGAGGGAEERGRRPSPEGRTGPA